MTEDHDCSTGSYGGISQYLVFTEEPQDPARKTKTWMVVSKSSGTMLGRIRWHGPWRQYTFLPEGNTIWNTGCLSDINAFITEAMDARKVKTSA